MNDSEWWNKYVGIPFAEHGRDRSGVDCWGLVRLVYKDQLEIWLPENLAYDTTRHYEQTASLVDEAKNGLHWLEIPKDRQQDLDVVCLKVGKLACHVGVVCNGGRNFLHCIDGVNSVIESLDGLRWGARIDSYWRFVA